MKQQVSAIPVSGREFQARRLAEAIGRLAPGRPIVLVVDGPAAEGHRRPPEAHRGRPEPLPAGEVQRLVAATLGARPGPPLLDLARVAAGRPAAIRELIAGLREEGL